MQFFALATSGAALTQTALARAAAIEQPTMAATLARMARDGLIERRSDPRDGRSALISLTPAASRKGARRWRPRLPRAINGAALAGLDEAAQAAFLEALATIVRSLEPVVERGDGRALR